MSKNDSFYNKVTSNEYYDAFSTDQKLVYIKSDELRILTLNLHCYQEEDQLNKFKEVAIGIKGLNPNFISFQEVAQLGNNWNNANINPDNSAFVIKRLLKQINGRDYNLIWYPAHIGFDKYEEGLAILTDLEIIHSEQYIFNSQKNLRRISIVICVKSEFGNIILLNTHLEYSDIEIINSQVKEILSYLDSKEIDFNPTCIIVTGDMNISISSLSDHPLNNFKQKNYMNTFGDVNSKKRGSLDRQIDHIYVKINSKLRLIDSISVFNGSNFKRVSDHSGIFTTVGL